MSLVNSAKKKKGIIAKADHLIRRNPGTQNLKCVDLSICPVRLLSFILKLCKLICGQDNLGTNTYSSALLVGEKGADLICEDLGEHPQTGKTLHPLIHLIGIKVRTPHAPVPHAPIPQGVPVTQQYR